MTPAVGYTEMKDSGVHWIGQIPKEWKVQKLFRCFGLIGSGTTPKSQVEDYYNGNIPWLQSGDINGGIVKSTAKSIKEIALTECSALHMYNAPFIAVAMYGASIANTSIVAIDACTNQACCVLSSPQNGIDYKFVFYAILSAKEELLLCARGGTQPNISQEILKQFRLPLPSLQEQTAIAAYLDTQCAKIDEIIAEAKASIEDYKQWKASIIYEAVTKGLDPDTEMKDSGIEWIGEIPKSVNCSFVGKHFEITLGKMLCNSPDNDQYTLEPYYCAANVHFSGILCDDLKEMWFSPLDKRKYLAQSGDLLVVEGGAGAGGSFVLSEQDKIAYFQNSILRVRPKRDNNVGYLKYLIEALVTQDYINYVCNRATIPHFTKEKLSATPFLVFSGIQQKGIADHLDDVCAKIDKIISQKQSLVFDLESYKKSLIYEVVTGKRRVC